MYLNNIGEQYFESLDNWLDETPERLKLFEKRYNVPVYIKNEKDGTDVWNYDEMDGFQMDQVVKEISYDELPKNEKATTCFSCEWIDDIDQYRVAKHKLEFDSVEELDAFYKPLKLKLLLQGKKNV